VSCQNKNRNQQIVFVDGVKWDYEKKIITVLCIARLVWTAHIYSFQSFIMQTKTPSRAAVLTMWKIKALPSSPSAHIRPGCGANILLGLGTP
jgi:hypothetical protein